MKQFDKFFYKKMQIEQEKSTKYYWYLINKERRGGVHFHGVQYHDQKLIEINKGWGDDNPHNFSAYGIEKHSKKPIYSNQKPIPNCEVTGGDCYPDGSSLQAKEQLGFINPNGTHDDYIWSTLHRYYGYWIEDREEQDAA